MRYFVPPVGVQQSQAAKTVSQATGANMLTKAEGTGRQIVKTQMRPPFSPAPVNAATSAEFMGKSRNVLDSINTPSGRAARTAVGGGPPAGIPRYQRAVAAGGTGPEGARPRAQDSRAFRPGAPPIMMSADTVKKASGHNPKLTPPMQFGAKAAVRAAQQVKPSIYNESPLGKNSPSFVRSSDGFRPPSQAGNSQLSLTPPQRAMPVGVAIARVTKPSAPTMPGKWKATESNLRPPNRGVRTVTGAQTFQAPKPKASHFQTPEATVKLGTIARPLPIKLSPGAPGMKQ